MGTAAPQLEQMKQGMKAAWMAGDFGQIAKYTEAAASAFIERLHIANGVDLLDVACGTGLVAVEAAKILGTADNITCLDPSAGMSLYVDGQLVGTNANTVAQSYSGYWRVGGDNLNGWNLDPWGSNSQGTTQPYSYYFNGTMADVAVYPAALSAAQVGAHYAAALHQ